MIKRFFVYLKSHGLQFVFQRAVLKILGLAEVKDEIRTLQFFLNMYHDASCAPPTKDPELRIMQLCDIELLRIVTNECNKLGLTYWLAYGTLLGAVRHKDFIPWDDDLDIVMPRKDYNRAITILKDNLESMGFSFEVSSCIGIGYNHRKTGLWLDILAADEYKTDKNYEETYNSLKITIPKFRKEFESSKRNISIQWIEKEKCKIIGGQTGHNKFIYLHPEFPYRAMVHPIDYIYPLSEIKFGEYFFNAPRDTDSYLRNTYGANYMGFPPKGVLHHDRGRGPLSTWAKKQGVDMKNVLETLKSM